MALPIFVFVLNDLNSPTKDKTRETTEKTSGGYIKKKEKIKGYIISMLNLILLILIQLMLKS